MASIPDDILRSLVDSIERLGIAVGRDAERSEAEVKRAAEDAYARGYAEGRHREAVERQATRTDPSPGPLRGVLGVVGEEIQAALATTQGKYALRALVYLALGGWVGGGTLLGMEAVKESAAKADPVVEVPDAE